MENCWNVWRLQFVSKRVCVRPRLLGMNTAHARTHTHTHTHAHTHSAPEAEDTDTRHTHCLYAHTHTVFRARARARSLSLSHTHTHTHTHSVPEAAGGDTRISDSGVADAERAQERAQAAAGSWGGDTQIEGALPRVEGEGGGAGQVWGAIWDIATVALPARSDDRQLFFCNAYLNPKP